jgi:hypothetical protein
MWKGWADVMVVVLWWLCGGVVCSGGNKELHFTHFNLDKKGSLSSRQLTYIKNSTYSFDFAQPLISTNLLKILLANFLQFTFPKGT